jgi:hypothetical protein
LLVVVEVDAGNLDGQVQVEQVVIENHQELASGCYSVSPLGSATALPVTVTTYPITVGGGGTASASNSWWELDQIQYFQLLHLLEVVVEVQITSSWW